MPATSTMRSTPSTRGRSSLHHPFRHLGWDELCDHYASRLRTEPARQHVDHGLEHNTRATFDPPLVPAATLDEARDRFRALDGLEHWQSVDDGALGEALVDVTDVSAALTGATQGMVLDIEELGAIAAVVRAGRVLTRVRHQAGDQSTAAMRSDLAALDHELCGDRDLELVLAALPEVGRELERSVERGDQGEFRLADGASEELRACRAAITQARRSLTITAERLLRVRDVVESLSDKFWTERDGRVVLPARNDSLGYFYAGGAIVHGSSASGQTIFVEPRELIAANNSIRETIAREAAESRRIRAALSKLVGQHAAGIADTLTSLVALDHVHARLALSRQLGGTTPLLQGAVDDAELALPRAGHALMLLAGQDPVRNDFSLRCGHALVISGPNAGGKTVALKTIGLCVLLAASGVRVPTIGRTIVPLFARLFTDVGDEQSIAASLSTFTAHMSHVRAALQHVKRGDAPALVLFDEVAVGTDPEQGAALAEAIVRHLVSHGATVVVTTHYDRLKLLAVAEHVERRERYHNAAVGFDVQRMQPTYRVDMGAPGSSSALVVAKRLGLPGPVLAEAERLLGAREVQVDALLRTIAAERSALTSARAEVDKLRADLSRRERELRERERRAIEKLASKKQRAMAAAVSEFHALEDELRRRRKELRRQGLDPDLVVDGETVLAEPKAELDKLRRREQRSAPGSSAMRSEFSPRVGDRVRVRALEAVGDVISCKGDKITVQLPNLRTTVSAAELEPATNGSAAAPAGSQAPTVKFSSNAGRHFGPDAIAVDVGFDNSLDLRGVRVEEVVDKLEPFLDRALLRERDVVVVLHGHGSGVLRKVVRERLAQLAHVRKHRGGLAPEGGDAVTVIWLEG